MTRSQTDAGTPILDLTVQEYEDFLDAEVRSGVGLSVTEFTELYLAGKLDESDPAVSDLVGLLRIGQNGHRTAA
jgi:hypothetical protein